VSLLSDARRYTREWRRRLRMGLWRITVRVVETPGGDPEASLCMDADPAGLTAEIEVARDCDPTRLRELVAHEVIHLVLWPMGCAREDGCESAYARAEEQAVSLIAAALVE